MSYALLYYSIWPRAPSSIQFPPQGGVNQRPTVCYEHPAGLTETTGKADGPR